VGKVLAPGFVLAAALVMGLMPTTASATVVNGSANINGTVTVSTLNGISFFGDGGLAFANIFSATPSSGSYQNMTGGTIQNLTGGPVVGPDSIIDFITFNVPTGNVMFDLQNIFAGLGTGACSGPTANNVGNTCTPPGSPFTLQQTNSGVTITLSLSGIAYTGTSGSGSSPTTGLFTAQTVIPFGTITSVLAAVGNNSLGLQSYSATFSSIAVPEPATFGMIGAALLGLGVLRRRVRS